MKLELNMLLGGPSPSGRTYDRAELVAQLNLKMESGDFRVHNCAKDPHEPVGVVVAMEIKPEETADMERVTFDVEPSPEYRDIFNAAESAGVKLALWGQGTITEQAVSSFELGGLYLDWAQPAVDAAYAEIDKAKGQAEG